MKRYFLVFALVMTAGAPAAWAQLVSIGALGGIRPTDTIGAGDESRRYIVGPSVEVKLFGRFAVEADALYQRLGDTTVFRDLFGSVSLLLVNRERANSWEFPLLAKYYFRPRTAGWQPFAGTGYAFRTTWFHSDGTSASIDANGAEHSSTFHDGFRSTLGVGASAVAGVRFQRGRLAFLPQVRYTRWGDSFGSLTKRNEVGLLLGVTF
jgi:hypothetical protein